MTAKKTTSKKTAGERGKATNLYLKPRDIAKLRELTAFLAGKGQRTSNSLIVRAAIHAAEPNSSFLKEYTRMANDDLRFNGADPNG